MLLFLIHCHPLACIGQCLLLLLWARGTSFLLLLVSVLNLVLTENLFLSVHNFRRLLYQQ